MMQIKISGLIGTRHNPATGYPSIVFGHHSSS